MSSHSRRNTREFIRGCLLIGPALLALVIAAYGTAGVAVYALFRRGKGPTPRTVLQAVYDQARKVYGVPAGWVRVWLP